MNNPNSSNPILFYYGDGKGRAEFSRLVFVYGDIPFEYRGISFQEYIQMRNSGQLYQFKKSLRQIGHSK